MKKHSWVSLLLAVCLLMTFPSLAESVYTPGTYSAAAFGMGGDVTVTMTFDANTITAVSVDAPDETPGFGNKATDALPQMILDAQTADVDAISTATVTSDAILQAAAACIAQARNDGEAATEGETPNEADVIVIGAGAAGLAAAKAARESGASVLVLEANGRVGGSAMVSAGNLNYIGAEWLETLERNDDEVRGYLDYTAADFPAEYAADLETVQADVRAYLEDTSRAGAYDSVAHIMLDHYLKGYGKDLDGNEVWMDYDYIRIGVERNEDIYLELAQEGMEVKQGNRPHFVTPLRGGTELIEVQYKIATDAGAQIITKTRAVDLVTDETGKVTGVIAIDPNGETVTFTANKGVIIATGSFAANLEMVVQYQNMATGISLNTTSSNPATNVGDGILMAEKLGAELRDMQFVGFIWRGYLDKANSAESSAIGGAKQLAVNQQGERYTEDSAASLLAATTSQTDAISNCVGDKAMYDALNAYSEDFAEDLEARGILFIGDTLEEAAQKAGIDSDALAQTVTTFNQAVDSGSDEAFGRTKFNGKVAQAPFVIVKLQAINHLTYGGLVTDLDTHVLKPDGTSIPGLYAAGDVVAGFEGAVHQTGECLTIVMHYGQVAGENAATTP